MSLNTAQHIHFIGIGGIGMSGLAYILKQRGYTISGSDCNCDQKSIYQLQEAGCTIYHDHHEEHVANSVDLVIYTAAVAHDNPELINARRRSITCMTRAELLAQMVNNAYGIAIAGAHGKTTTSSLIAHILIQAGKNPSYAIGGHLHNYNKNADCGSGPYFVAETCENDKTTHVVKAQVAVVTNIDYEHLDIYKDLDEIKSAFLQFMANVPEDGTIIACYENQHIRDLLTTISSEIRKKIITYGFSPEASVYIQNYTLEPHQSHATIYTRDGHVGQFTLALPGTYNLLNALAAYAATRAIGISFTEFSAACASFKGVDRRFTFKGTYKGATVFDDYGHHPSEIEHVLPVALRTAQAQNGRLIIAFQPHRFSRTDALWHDFIKVFAEAHFDTLIITDIYGAFEQPRDNVTSERMAREVQQQCHGTSLYAPEDADFESVKKIVDAVIQPHDVLLFLGAGKINKLITRLNKI